MSDVLSLASATVSDISELRYPTATTALVLIDVINEFLADDGKVNPMIRPMLDKLQTIAHLERLVAGARAAQLPIFYAPHGLDEHSFDGFMQLHPRQQMAIDNKAFWKGSRGATSFRHLHRNPVTSSLRNIACSTPFIVRTSRKSSASMGSRMSCWPGSRRKLALKEPAVTPSKPVFT